MSMEANGDRETMEVVRDAIRPLMGTRNFHFQRRDTPTQTLLMATLKTRNSVSPPKLVIDQGTMPLTVDMIIEGVFGDFFGGAFNQLESKSLVEGTSVGACFGVAV